MDGLSLFASANEIRAALEGGRIDKVQQTEREELLISVRASTGNYRLLINSSASDNRVQLTGEKKPSPAEAPAFLMLLRKRIMGGRLTSFTQDRLDRVLKIGIEARDELGDSTELFIIAELMGKYSNIILVSAEGKIIDSIKRVSPSMSSVRPILPGLLYTLPPAQDKLDPIGARAEDFLRALSSEGKLSRALSNAFFGLSPATAEAIAARYTDAESTQALCEDERKALARSLEGFFHEMSEKCAPSVLVDGEKRPKTVYPFRVTAGESIECGSMGEALDMLYSEREKFDWIKRHGASIRKILQNNIERCEKKLALYSDALNASEDMRRNRLAGELITANLGALKQGEKKAVLLNYYDDPPTEFTVELDPLISPNDNAQRYYKKYQKQKAARDMAEKQREETLTELDYIEGQLDNLTKCTTEAELGELIEELREEGYIRRDREKKKQKLPRSKPMRFVSTDGVEILVGKNNTQNDQLTLKTAAPDDIWLHTKNIPGSHVIVRSGGACSDATLEEAANLAAFYSRARGSEKVAVDYTPKKFVKKPAGAKPGMVIYSTNRTVYITPDGERAEKLKAD